MTPDPVEKLGNVIAAMAKERGQSKKGYTLSKATLDKKVDPTLTCIGGACDVYRSAGFEFPNLPGFIKADKSAVGGDYVTEYNPTFAENYDKAGFDKVELARKEDISQMSKYLRKGDMVQYWKEGKPYHTNIATEVNPDGTYGVFNNYSLSVGEEPLYNLDPTKSDDEKVVIYRPKSETAMKALEKGKDIVSKYEVSDKKNKFLANWQTRNLVPDMSSGNMLIKNKAGETIDTGVGIKDWQGLNAIEKNTLISKAVNNLFSSNQ
jgi:hypothetical protein